MSRRPRKQKIRKASMIKRQKIASKVAERFNSLNPEEKRRHVDQTLTNLVNMTVKQQKKLAEQLTGKGRPSEEKLELINHLLVVFLHSIKTEYRYHYATMIYKRLNQPIPPDLPKRLEQVRHLIFLSDIGVSPEVYKQLYELWEKMGNPPYDEFFSKLIEANMNG